MLDLCSHVYQTYGTEYCEFCNKATHDIDWAEQIRLHQDWVASGKAEYLGWVSI